MKRHTDLWPQLLRFSNLLNAAEKAARGKRGLANVARFHVDLERELGRLRQQLLTRTYVPGPYHTFRIYEPKERLISAAPFRDRVVHHALVNVLAPVFEPTFIPDSYACRAGKGTHAAVDRFTQFARACRHVLHADVSKYFPSIDHEILKGLIARKVKDEGVLWLVNVILDHSNPQEPVEEWYPGDDLFARGARRRGRTAVCCAAAPGTTTRGTAAPPTATTTRPATATTTSASGWCCFRPRALRRGHFVLPGQNRAVHGPPGCAGRGAQGRRPGRPTLRAGPPNSQKSRAGR